MGASRSTRNPSRASFATPACAIVSYMTSAVALFAGAPTGTGSSCRVARPEYLVRGGSGRRRQYEPHDQGDPGTRETHCWKSADNISLVTDVGRPCAKSAGFGTVPSSAEAGPNVGSGAGAGPSCSSSDSSIASVRVERHQ